VRGPALLRTAAASTRDTELRREYLNLALVTSLFGPCIKGAGVAIATADWPDWAKVAPASQKSEYCIAGAELSGLTSLRLYLCYMDRLIRGQKDTQLTHTDLEIRGLLSPSAQQLWDPTVMDQKFISVVLGELMAPGGDVWLARRDAALPVGSPLRRDVDYLLAQLRATMLLKMVSQVKSPQNPKPPQTLTVELQQHIDAMAVQVARVIISNRVIYLRAAMKKLP
jgi:hypothetical protein